MTTRTLLLWLGAAVLAATAAPAQTPDVSPLSPRAALTSYLTLARDGRFADAAHYLILPDSLADDGPALARRLKLVLDHYLWFEMDQISPLASGDRDDGLPDSIEHLGIVTIAGTRYPVRLSRDPGVTLDTSGTAPTQPAWRFTAATMANVNTWYGTLRGATWLDRLPAPLLRSGPFSLLYWQWLALPVFLLLSAIIGWAISRAARWIAGRAAKRTRSTWDDEAVRRIGAPLTTACTMVVAAALLPLLDLARPTAEVAMRVIRGALYFTLFWSLWRLVDIGRDVALGSRWALATASSRALVPLGSRALKVILFAVAIVAFVSFLGFPVASLIAGLGLGGLALALAAQKTVENLFGAFSLGLDQPFREGDFVRVEDFVGTVEAIGLRSTRFRTLDRTIVSIPNGKLADARLETFAERDRMRLAATIGLVYETTPAQMREVLAGFEQVLRQHPHIWPDAMVVKFREFSASSLDIEVMAWFRTPEWSNFQTIRQEVLLGFMDVVEKSGTSFAFPTRTVHVASLPPQS